MSGPDPYCLTCHGTGQDPRDPEKLCLGCQPYYPPIVDPAQGRRWLTTAAALVLGALIGITAAEVGDWLFGGPAPSWVAFAVVPVYLAGSWAWRKWRERRSEREPARAGDGP